MATMKPMLTAMATRMNISNIPDISMNATNQCTAISTTERSRLAWAGRWVAARRR